MEVVVVLKELPIHVRMVCGRSIASQDPLCPIDTAQHQAAFQSRVNYKISYDTVLLYYNLFKIILNFRVFWVARYKIYYQLRIVWSKQNLMDRWLRRQQQQR